MKMLGRFVAVMLMCGLSTAANAAWFTGVVYKIQVGPNGEFTAFLNPLSSGSSHECGGTAVTFYDATAAGAKMIYAALLAYESQETPVQFSIISCSGSTGVFSHIEST